MLTLPRVWALCKVLQEKERGSNKERERRTMKSSQETSKQQAEQKIKR